MRELGNNGVRPRKRRPVVSIAAALLGAAVLCQPGLAHAAHGGGGGFHGGGFHGGGFHGVFPPWWDVLYLSVVGSYPDYGYYDYSQPYTGQTWHYCSDPAGYYPYVTQCNTGWQPVPAS
jgi:hypothetical protein